MTRDALQQTLQQIEQQILSLIESSIEDTRVPDAIAAHADKRAGKPVTKTDAEQLQAQLGIPVRIRRQYKMTHVSWAVGTGINPWSDERSLLIAHKDTNVNWPTGDDLRKTEHGYFGARDERNAARKKLLGEYKAQETFFEQQQALYGKTPTVGRTSAVSRAAIAILKMREARAELEKLTDYDEPMNVVRFTVEKLAKEE